MMIAMEEIEAADLDLTQDSELQTLLVQGPVIEAAHELFSPEDSEINKGLDDIKNIINSCLKEVKKSNSKYAIKVLCKLTAVSEYVKLRTQYQKHKVCKWPCLSASMAIAQCMGKGPYFACQIRHSEVYLKKYHQLPLLKIFMQHRHHTLLDNESILHDVRTYLASQALGSVSPWTFCQHINEVILPALSIEGAISERTAQRWLTSKLGYECKEAKKGIYVDGHERPNVIDERIDFIDKMLNRYEW
jgi:hypothetical protein